MKHSFNDKKTLEIIERLKFAQIGEYKKWKKIIKKIKENQDLSSLELEYFSKFTRIYKNSTITHRSKIYHARLSEHDERPPCRTCKEKSEFYCNINDEYFCTIHVVGHDENEN
ncbi:MAG: hypothetical protein OEM21_07265 [Nitrosopumilus sp.]|nr:hypothetical protein [Nitrosopumilus sp.]